MLRIAVPNKGVLAEPAAAFLQEAGYRVRRDLKDLYQLDAENGVEFFYLRPRDIATYVGSGALDIGITGKDLLIDSESPASTLLDLGFGKSAFYFAALPGKLKSVQDLEGLRIGTSYPRLVKNYLSEKNITVEVVALDGAVENSVRLGLADAVADVVETGATLRAAGLELFGESLLSSTALVIGSPALTSAQKGQNEEDDDKLQRLRVILKRLEGVKVAKSYVLVDYDVPLSLLDAAAKLTPGIESPTISPLRDPEWVAVRAMVPKNRVNSVIDDLDDLGARAILVSAIHSVRV